MNKENEINKDKEKFFSDPKKKKKKKGLKKWIYPLIIIFFVILLIFIVLLANNNYSNNNNSKEEELGEQQSQIKESLELLEQQQKDLEEWVEQQNTDQDQQKKDQFYIEQFPEIRDREAIQRLSLEYNLSIEFLYRWVYLESHVNPLAVRYETNGTISYGYLQLNSLYLDYFSQIVNDGQYFNALDSVQNLEIGVKCLIYLRDAYCDGDIYKALLAYNCGISRLNNSGAPLTSIEYATIIMEGYFEDEIELVNAGAYGIKQYTPEID